MGFEVTVFEKNETIGGKLDEVRLGEYRCDTGPSLLTIPFVSEELFAFAGHSWREFLQIVPLGPVCRYFFPDGTRLDTSMNVQKMKTEMARLSAGDAEVY